MIRLTPAPKRGLHGQLTVPGDKSISHRALMFGAIAQGHTDIENFLDSDDVLHTMGVFRALGVQIEQTGTRVRIQGQGLEHFQAPKAPLDMGNSGTSTRLLMGLLSQQPFDMTIFGDGSLIQRPMQRVLTPLAQMGANIILTDGDKLPGVIHANHTLTGITYVMPVASAQVKSALILAGMQATGQTKIIEKLPSRDHTERMLRQFGGEIQSENGVITVSRQPALIGQHVVVPADISSAAFFMVAALITPNSELTLKNVGINPTRDGVLRLLRRMGADLQLSNIDDTNEPTADITVRTQPLHGIHITAADIPSAVDEIPILALAATQAQGDTVISGAAELRVKETDRIATVVAELTKLGADIEALPDGMIIHGGTPLHGSTDSTLLETHGDHRIGMMNAVAALIAHREVVMTGEDAMSVSYPGFLADLMQVMR